MRLYSFAVLNFCKGNYAVALELTQKIRFELFLYKPDMRVLQLKIFYKLGYHEQLLSMIDSTLHFLRNSREIRESFKQSIRNLIKYIKELERIKKYNPDKKDIAMLLKRIGEEKYLGQKKWLLSEAELLAKK
jgi:hypothetical protein